MLPQFHPPHPHVLCPHGAWNELNPGEDFTVWMSTLACDYRDTPEWKAAQEHSMQTNAKYLAALEAWKSQFLEHQHHINLEGERTYLEEINYFIESVRMVLGVFCPGVLIKE